MGVDEIIAEEPIDHFLEYQRKKEEAAKAKSSSANSGFNPQNTGSDSSNDGRMVKARGDSDGYNKGGGYLNKGHYGNISLGNAIRKLAMKNNNAAAGEYTGGAGGAGGTGSGAGAGKGAGGGNADSSGKIMTPQEAVEEAVRMVSGVESIEDLKKCVFEFEGCSIKKLSTNTVFCDGDPQSDVMIIGEAPGNHEDLQGIPFCGQSGMLLNNMLKAIGRKRESVYISNTLFWRPPGNRRPTPEELNSCRPFVEKHIALVKPKLLITMGATAMSSVLGISEGITRSRGQFIDYSNEYMNEGEAITATIMFHPSYLLRQSNKKALAWQDLLRISSFLE